jgi:hypothetical protein
MFKALPLWAGNGTATNRELLAERCLDMFECPYSVGVGHEAYILRVNVYCRECKDSVNELFNLVHSATRPFYNHTKQPGSLRTAWQPLLLAAAECGRCSRHAVGVCNRDVCRMAHADDSENDRFDDGDESGDDVSSTTDIDDTSSTDGVPDYDSDATLPYVPPSAASSLLASSSDLTDTDSTDTDSTDTDSTDTDSTDTDSTDSWSDSESDSAGSSVKRARTARMVDDTTVSV